MKSKKRIVLAYSGGLDTSIILKWLQENYNAEVICYTADIGQKIDRKKIISNAKKFGVKSIIIEDLKNMFIVECPKNEKYTTRLNRELDLINQKNLVCYLIRAIEILNLTDYIPHVTRGYCGSSLVCYLLGISNVDPIKYGITFERFLNDYRDTLPDIDLDFPHFLRDEVFLKLELN